MTQKYLSTLAIAAIATSAMTSSPASAKKNVDWIEKISIEKNGIDTRAIEVLPENGRYTKLVSGSHRFLLGGYVKAKKNKKIARVRWQSKNNPYFTSGPNKPSWEKPGLIRLGLRETTLEYDTPIALSRITWIKSPVAACETLKMQKMTQGMSQKAVLAKDWNAKANAAFYIKADVIRKNAKLKENNYDTETDMMPYQVNVRCLAQPRTAKQNTSTNKGGKPPARAPRVPIE